MRELTEETQTNTDACADARHTDAASAFTCIYRKHYQQTLDTAALYCKSKVVCEEIAQEVFIKLWMNKEAIRDIRDLQAYLFMLTRNLSVDYLRKQKLEQAVFKEYSFIIAKDMFVEESMAREVQRVMMEAVEQLHPQQKRVYQLKKLYGWRRDEIAKTLKISENTVKATMQKAICSVKKYVKERVA
jgi:RNA polymerase sigma-70 factor (ECF subfamily)